MRTWSMVGGPWSLVVAAVVVAGCLIGADAQTLREYQAKGAYLVNFAKFVEWPDDAFGGAETPVDICVVGERWIYEDVETMTRSKVIGRRPVRLRPRNEITDCHVLFVAADEATDTLFPKLSDFTVRVGEAPKFLASGGHINFHLHRDRVHFEIAPAVVHIKRFKVSSRLLVLGDKE